MYRLAYVSTARTATTSSELQDILEVAIRQNRESGVTGMLFYNGLNFLQILEGPEDRVDATFKRICTDDRHSHVVTIFREKANRRSFVDDPMLLQTVKSGVGNLPKGIAVTTDLNLYLPAGLPDYLRTMLTSFSTEKD